ncbi:hypothetical protein [Paenibacillus cremeus]|uniref:Alpha glucuronidase N-terminal domain-containing protein n=1 Tax=Paenibacillus cremeus TaxID=2163881 RepID=A0A559JCG9_9BACL|nr:hypothetical protein [Paenibacillus cremeus]TVX97575.1 hypothetical protein FPZ49_34920 [Paenibacillus cremeus]
MTVGITYREDSPQIVFAVERLVEALREIGENAEMVGKEQLLTAGGIWIEESGLEAAKLFGELSGELQPEGFRIISAQREGRPLLVVAALDEAGAMYGTLELAERLRGCGSLSEVQECVMNARFPFRAIKFNLPWSTYRRNESFRLQIETIRDLGFWQRFLDRMAENRYNALTLWNLHPFPYMFRTANFPLATPFSDEELAEWKRYWTALFRMAKDRGIETYLVNWNIFVSESFREHYDGEAISDDTFYHYGDSYSTEQIKQYTRESITQLINEYPDLTGFGISLGERMNDMTPEDRQEWIKEVYFEGIREADRPVKFIHRAPFSVDPSVTRDAIESSDVFEGPVWVEVKFNWSHAYSSPKLLLTHGGSNGMEGYWNPPPRNYKITWMVRNEDFFTLRWAQPDFIREHIAENGQEYVGGYFVGSECFIPGKDYSHREGSPHVSWTYAFEKHWLYYMLWGRLLYDPSTPDRVFENELDRRYGSPTGNQLLKAYSAVCKMPMALASFYKFTWDFTLYAEGFLSTGEDEFNNGQAFISLQDMLGRETFDPSYLSIRNYMNRVLQGESLEGYTTPVQLAERLEADAQRGLSLITGLSIKSPTLECELCDIEAWAHLSLYFADKLRAGVSYERFLRTGDESERRKALSWLKAPHAAGHWDNLIRVTQSHYHEQPLLHLGATPFSWERMRPMVQDDIAFVESQSSAGSRV